MLIPPEVAAAVAAGLALPPDEPPTSAPPPPFPEGISPFWTDVCVNDDAGGTSAV